MKLFRNSLSIYAFAGVIFLITLNIASTSWASAKKPTGSDVSQILIFGSTNMEILVTSPSGKKTGVARGKSEVNEDPNSSFIHNNPEGDDGPKPEYSSAKNLQPGKYRIDFFNLNGGEYKINVKVLLPEYGRASKDKIIKGRLTPQENDYFEIIISEDKEATYKLPRSANTK